MLMLASATQKEVESVSDNIEQLSKDVSKLSQIGSDLIDKAVAFGIDIIIAVIIFVIGKFIIKFILKFVDRIFAKSSADEGVAKFIHSVLKVALYIILAITICGQIGIETTSFAAIVASGGLAIGLAFEGSLSNFAGGVMILIMKPFTVGDYIESNGVEGTVYKIDIFYTSLKTVDNKSVKLPNGTLSNSILTNYSMNEKRRVDVEVGIGYDDNIERIQDVWQDADGVRPVTGLGADELPAQVRNTPEEDVTDQENQQGTGDAGAEVHKPPQQRILRLAAKGTTLCFHIKHAPF